MLLSLKIGLLAIIFVATSGAFFSRQFRQNRFLVTASFLVACVSSFYLFRSIYSDLRTSIVKDLSVGYQDDSRVYDEQAPTEASYESTAEVTTEPSTDGTILPPPERQDVLKEVSARQATSIFGPSSGILLRSILRKPAMEDYVADLLEHLKDNSIPEFSLIEVTGRRMSSATFATIRIGRNGHLRSLEISRSSGNVFSDTAIIQAIKRSAPFDALPNDAVEVELLIGCSYDHDLLNCNAITHEWSG